MNKILLSLSLAVLAASAVRAQSFEDQVGAAVQPFILEDSFAGIGACGILDAKTFRAWTLEEASDLANPCLKAVGSKYSAEIVMQAGVVASATEGRPLKPGLILKTDLIPGSKPHRDMVASLERRRGELLGYKVRLLTRGETAPASVSAVQEALKQCILTSVVRDLRSGADFVKIYGSCLTKNPDLKIGDLRAGSGLTVNLTAAQDAKTVEALNGVVVVNAGRGPVSVLIIANAVQFASL